MGGEEDRAARIAECPHLGLELVRRQRIQPHKRLVHHNESGVVQQRRDDGKLLLHAMGIGPDGLRQILGQAELVSILPDALGALLCSYPENIRDEVQILNAGHVFIQLRIIRQIGQPALAFQRIFPHGDAVHPDLSGIELLDAAAAFDGGRLSGAVVPDECAQLSGADVQAEIPDRRLAAVGLGQVFDSEHKLPPCQTLFCEVFPLEYTFRQGEGQGIFFHFGQDPCKKRGRHRVLLCRPRQPEFHACRVSAYFQESASSWAP